MQWSLLVAVALLTVVSGQSSPPAFDTEVSPKAVRGGVSGGGGTGPEPKRAPSTSQAARLLSYADLFEGGARPQEAALMNWMFAHGFINTQTVQLRGTGYSGRGMFLARDVKAGDELFSVPVELMVYTSNPHYSRTTKRVLEIFREKFRTPGYVADDFELTEMALIVMFELRDPKSFFHPYLSMLQMPMCPAFYNEQQLQAMEYPWLNKWRGYFLSDALLNFKRLLTFPEFELLATTDIEHEFLRAASTVLQRSFDWGPDSRREYVLVPFLDMVNHDATVKNNYYYSNGPLKLRHVDGMLEEMPTPRGMVLAADSDRTGGQEVFIDYSHQSNTVQLLLQYGFCSPENPNDYIVFRLDVPANVTQVLTQLRLPFETAVGVDGIIDAAFIRAVNLIWARSPDPTAAAYERVLAALDADISAFSTTLEEDVARRQHENDRVMHAVLSYRIEAKRVQRIVRAQLAKDLDTVRAGQVPAVSTLTKRKDWPIRHVIVPVPAFMAAQQQPPTQQQQQPPTQPAAAPSAPASTPV